MAHDVFVSYSSKDKIAADAVVAALENAGIRCWVAPRDILIGQEWAESILHAIESSRLMVLVFTQQSNDSTHVRKEVERAVHHGLAVAPIRLTDAVPAGAMEYFLSSSHWLDAMVPPLDQHLLELTRKVKLLLNGEVAAPPGLPKIGAATMPAQARAVMPAPKVRKSSFVGFAAIAALLLVAAGVFAAFKCGWIGNAKVGPPPMATTGTPSGNGTGVIPTSPINPAVDPAVSTQSPAQLTPAAPPALAKTLVPMISVFSADDLIRSIGPDRILLLKSEEYIVSDVVDQQMEFVRWDRKFDGKSVTVRNVKNLTIVGSSDKPVRLIVRPRYAFVLNFEKCQDIVLTNLTLGHEPNKGECDSGVVGATDCTGLSIIKCDLFGCGTEGLTFQNVRKLKFSDSKIRDCSYGILSLNACTNASFARSRFTGNSQYWGMKINDCKDVSFDDCDIENNKITDGALFQINSSTNVAFIGGHIQKNHASSLMEDADTVSIQNTQVEDNEFKRQ